MWRSNYEEDWERRKTYLIRSLFQDIPVLSPVPEESRYDAGSPSDIPPSRPYSPLPALVIERMPNRHDHSKKFYQDLERKMKKLYKKLFFNEDSSSVEDLIEMYGGDLLSSKLENFCRDVEATRNASLSTVRLLENRSQSSNSSEIASHEIYDKHLNKVFSEVLTASSKTSESMSPQSKNVESSIQSLFQTQVTTVAEVHKEPSREKHIDTLQCHPDDLSPVLEYHRIGFNKTFPHLPPRIEISREDEEDQDEESMGKIIGTKTLGSRLIEDSQENQQEDSQGHDLDKNYSNKTSDMSIEVMRRQKEISPSFGSLHNEPIRSPSPERVALFTNIELWRKFSPGLPEESSSDDLRNVRESSFSAISTDFDNLLTTSTPRLVDQSKTDSASNFSVSRKRLRSEFIDKDAKNESILITKRRKFEHVAIQTSLISESETSTTSDERNEWDQVKKNFFVGMPRIFKLCPINDHSCRND